MKKYILIIIFIIILLIIGGIIGFFSEPKLMSVKESPLNATCGPKWGILVAKGPVVQFGVVPYGQSVTKDMEITNNEDFSMTIRTEATGEIADYFSAESPKKIKPGETVKIIMAVTCSEEEVKKYMEGTFKVSLYK